MSSQRNHVIDLARVASVAVVVVFHGLLYQVRLVDGVPVVVPWAAPTALYPLTWVLMIMPLFFVAGGFGHARTVDRVRREGASYGHFLASRGRRVVGPLVVFVTVCTLVATAAAWAGRPDAAATLSRQLMQLLWFISVYLVVIAAAPAMVRLHDRHGVAPLLGLVVAAAAVDAWSFHVGDDQLRNANLFLVWPFAHQLGIAYERGWFRRGPVWTPWLALGGGVATVAALVFGAGYPATSVGFADLPIANVQPPTLAMAALAVAQCGALGLVERAGLAARLPRRAQRALATANALLVTTYLWHIFCILAGGLGLVGLALLDPGRAPLLLHQLTVAIVGLLVVTAFVPLVARLELRLVPPLGESQDAALAVVAFILLTVGTVLVWLLGTAVHPESPGAAAGVALVWGGALVMVRAADSESPRVRVAE